MHTTASSPAAGSPAAGSPAALKYLWISVGALGACVLALGGTLLAQKLPGDAPQAAPAAPQVIEEKAPPALARQAQPAPDSRANRVLPVAQAPAPVCASCGRVESVQPVAQAAPATGVGAVAGGVLGGVLGNQIGKGSGRTAATVLGAVGGGYVGHQVEQRTRTTTVYQMRVRMDDGSLRTFTRAQPVAEGTPVRVEGKGFRVDDRAAAGAQPVYVSDRNY
jgi:outer membrane lipoprotein SlyB